MALRAAIGLFLISSVEIVGNFQSRGDLPSVQSAQSYNQAAQHEPRRRSRSNRGFGLRQASPVDSISRGSGCTVMFDILPLAMFH